MRFNRYNVRMRSWRPRFALLGLGLLCVLGLGDSLGASGTFHGGNGKLAYVSGGNVVIANADGTGAASVARATTIVEREGRRSPSTRRRSRS